MKPKNSYRRERSKRLAALGLAAAFLMAGTHTYTYFQGRESRDEECSEMIRKFISLDLREKINFKLGDDKAFRDIENFDAEIDRIFDIAVGYENYANFVLEPYNSTNPRDGKYPEWKDKATPMLRAVDAYNKVIELDPENAKSGVAQSRIDAIKVDELVLYSERDSIVAGNKKIEIAEHVIPELTGVGWTDGTAKMKLYEKADNGKWVYRGEKRVDFDRHDYTFGMLFSD